MKTKHHPMLSPPVTRSGDQIQNNRICRRWFALALGGFLFTSIFALLPSPAYAQCKQWDVSGHWVLRQSNTTNQIDLRQNGTVITGTASFVSTDTRSNTIRGDVDGTVKGDHFAVKIYWRNNTIGVYNGTIGPSGRLEGTGYEQRSPSTKVIWFSDRPMKCADAKVGAGAPDWMKAGQTSPAPTPRGVTPGADDYKKLQEAVNKASAQKGSAASMSSVQAGAAAAAEAKAKEKAAAQKAPAGPPPKPPYIAAAPALILIPKMHNHGMTTLIWDGGKRHPYAEIWVSVNGADPTQIVEQGKGTRQVPVERGKTYRYILTDSGEELGSVNVRTQSLPGH